MNSPARRKTTKSAKSARADKSPTADKSVKAAKPAKVGRSSKADAALAASSPRIDATRRLLQQLIAALDGKKVGDLQVLDVSALSSITDYLVVATATSDPHLRALRIELERVLDENKARILGVDTSKGSGWTVVDAFEIMVHVFTPENREKYRLELLWKDAKELPVADLLASK